MKQTDSSTLKRCCFPLLLVGLLSGCVEPQPVRVRPDAVALAQAEQALALVFRELDQGAATVRPPVEAAVAPTVVGLSAPKLAELRAQLQEQAASVDGLRSRHVVGENLRGYLEVRGALSGDEERIVSDENANRRTVFRAIAAAVGTDAEFAGRQRAQRIAAIAAKGVLLQGPDGVWYSKP